MSIDPCNSSNEHFINSDVNNPLLAGEKYKIAKYAKPISSVNENSHARYNLCPFVFFFAWISRYISYRSTLHDAVRDQIHAKCNSYHIESFVEPLLRSLDINESVRDSEYGKRRADVVVPSFDDVMNVVDVVTVDVCKKNALKNAQSEVSPLDDSELYKRKKYANPLKELKHVRHVDYQIFPFAISLYGRLGKTALNFIDDFENLVKKRMNKRFDRRLWLNRIVFTIFKSIPKMISKALMSVSAHYENIAAVRFDGVEACFEDIDF
ncbi:hypothetical protein P9112_013696 [Eukaryota sp. TZLM1-RC]